MAVPTRRCQRGLRRGSIAARIADDERQRRQRPRRTARRGAAREFAQAQGAGARQGRAAPAEGRRPEPTKAARRPLRARRGPRRSRLGPIFASTCGVIGVEPGELGVATACPVDQPPLDRREGQRLEAEHLLFGALDLASRPPAPDSRCGCRIRRSCNSRARWTGSCRPAAARRRPLARFRPARCAAALRGPTGSCRRRGRCHGHSRARLPTTAGGRSCRAGCRACPWGSSAVAMAMWPLSTRVKRSRISRSARRSRTVRVMSVVPSAYWPPESTR